MGLYSKYTQNGKLLGFFISVFVIFFFSPEHVIMIASVNTINHDLLKCLD